ncbi:hypothetical protein Tco_0172830 [Tanacetum coccineum]
MDNINSPPPPEVPTSILSEKVLKLNSILRSLNLIPSSHCSGIVCKKEKDSDVILVELIKNNDCPGNEEMEEDDDVLGEEEFGGDHFDKFPTRSELAYHKYLMCALIPSMILSDPIIVGGNPLNLKIPCNIGHDISSVIDPRISPVILAKELYKNSLIKKLLLYQNYLREFWCTTMVEDPSPPINDSEARPLKEFIIKFTVMNGQMPLTLEYKTFCETTGLDYNKDNYVSHPFPEVVKAKLGKIAINEALVLGGNHSFTEQLNSIQQLIIFSLLIGSKIDIREIIFSDLITRLMEKSRQGYNPSNVTSIELTASMIDVINLESSVTPLPCSEKKGKKKKTQTVTQPKPKS